MPGDTSGVGGGPPARLCVRLLGVVEVILDGRRLRAFNSLRLQRALALIAIRKDLQHRSRLAFELWPDSTEGQARTNLRKLIHDLRQALPDIGDFLEIDNEIVRWIATGPSEVDVLRFREAVALGDLERSARIYTGDLLPACYDRWVLSERARLRAEAHGVFKRLIDASVQRGDHTSTVVHARRALELEPTDDAVVRIQMAAHVALADRAAALRAYHRYAEVLEREYELPPGDEVSALYRELRIGTVPAREPPADAALIAESPFVGRTHELGRLVGLWKTTLQGGAHLALITGEPGIGKSRLATELGRRVRAEGHMVASARAYEAAGRLPWGPVVDLLRSESLRSGAAALDTPWRRELARLLPELHDAPAPSGTGQTSDPAGRLRLFDAANRAITAGDRPRLLIVDDLQWCDAETIELIGFLIHAGERAPVLIVGTVRWEELSEGHALIGLVDDLGRDRTVTTLPLDRLDEATTATLAHRLGAVEMDNREIAARLWSETEGNPLFVIETLRAGIPADRGEAALTSTIRAVLRARLAQLPYGAGKIAEVAAVVGRPFTVGLIASATGIDDDELIDPLDELWRRRIIREHGSAYDFSHDKLRAVALEMVSPARRRQLHRAVAAAMVEEYGTAVGDLSAQLAAHYDQAGLVDQAIDAYRLAGTGAVAVSAFDEAATAFRRALSLLAELPGSAARDALELDIRIALGSPLVALDGYGSREAHHLYERALSLCRRLGRTVDPPILRGLGLARLQGCRFDDSTELGQALLDHESGDPVARTEGRYLLGVSAFWTGDLAKARHHLEAAIESYDASHRNEHLTLYAQDPKAVCLVRLAWVELWTGDPGRAAETARSAYRLARDLDHVMTLWYVITYSAIIAAESQDVDRLTELLADADLLWKRLPLPYLMIVGEALRGWLDARRGSPGGIDRIVQSVARSRADGETLHLTYCLLLLARARGSAGEIDEGRAAAREGLEWSRRRRQGYLEAELLRVDGELAWRNGETGTAAASMRSAADLASTQGAHWLELRALHSLARRFPDPDVREQLRELLDAIPSGRELPAFRAAARLLSESD